MARCCLPAGYRTGDHQQLLNRLREAGVDLPADARVWGPGDGWQWRIIAGPGRQTGIRSRIPLATAAASPALTVTENGEVLIKDSGQPTPPVD